MTFAEQLTNASITWVAVAIGYITARTIITIKKDK